MSSASTCLGVLGPVGRAAAKTIVRGARTINCARALSRSEPAAAASVEDDVRGAGADRGRCITVSRRQSGGARLRCSASQKPKARGFEGTLGT